MLNVIQSLKGGFLKILISSKTASQAEVKNLFSVTFAHLSNKLVCAQFTSIIISH